MGRGLIIILPLAISLIPLNAWCIDCPDLHFTSSSFARIQQDYEPGLLYVWPGDDSRKHGVAFLIEGLPPYYLTARHVVEVALSNPTVPITGIDIGQHKMTLTVVGDDPSLDVALLRSDGNWLQDRANPYELFFSNIGFDDVTFSGLAYASEHDVRPTSPKEDTFRYNKNATEMQLRVNTNDGDSGAPVYTKQGLVVGIVTNKQAISQATAITMKTLSKFVGNQAKKMPVGGLAWQLRDYLLSGPNRDALVRKLNPSYVPGRISNFQFLGAIELILDLNEMKALNHELVYCPVIQAAHDRGLFDTALKLERAEAEYLADKKPKVGQLFQPAQLQASQDFTTSNDPDRAEAIGDILLNRAAEWDGQGDPNFYVSLSAEAQSSFRDAIVAYLRTDKRPLGIVASNSRQNDAVDSARILLALGIDYSQVETGQQTNVAGDSLSDDRFASLLDKYYRAAEGAEGRHIFGLDIATASRLNEPEKAASLNVIASWATLISRSPAQKAKSWTLLADAMLKAGEPDSAARSIAEANRIQPVDSEALNIYEIAKKLQSRGSSDTVASIDSQLSSEAPLTSEDVKGLYLTRYRGVPPLIATLEPRKWKGASISNSGKVSFAWGSTAPTAKRNALDECRLRERCEDAPDKVTSVESSGWLVVVNCNGRLIVGSSRQDTASAESEAKSKTQTPENCRTDRAVGPTVVAQGDSDVLWKAVAVSASGNVEFKWGLTRSEAEANARRACGRDCGIVSVNAEWWVAVMKCGRWFPIGASQWDIVQAEIIATEQGRLPEDARKSCSVYREYVGGVRGGDQNASKGLAR
jgi:hypothetical protein